MKRLNALTFKQLRALEAVVATGSITQAASLLGLTPPAVHTQLRLLEDNFGCAMLVRGGQPAFQPTPEGQALLDAHHKAQSGFRMAINRIEALRKGLAGHVVLGVVSTGKYFAPGLVADLLRAFPDIDVTLRVGNRETILSALDESAVDLAIMGRPPRDPPVVALAIGDHPHVMIAPKGHPLTLSGRVRAEDILSQRIIVREQGSGTRILTNRYLDRIGEGRLYETTEVESNETIKQAVMAGLGIAMISLHTVTEELRAGRLAMIEAEDLPIIRKWYLLHRQDHTMTPAMASVRDHISSRNGAFLPTL